MKKLAASLLVCSLALGSAASAGGPVVVEDEPKVEAASPRSGWIVPLVVGVIILCAIACGNSDDPQPLT